MKSINLSISVKLESQDHAARLIKESMNLMTIAIEHRFTPWMRWYAIDADREIRGYEDMPHIIDHGNLHFRGHWDVESLSEHRTIVKLKSCNGWRHTLTRIKS